MSTTVTNPAIGMSAGVDSPKFPGWWTITAIATAGRRLITVQPDRSKNNWAARGVRVPPEMIIAEPYDPADFAIFALGAVVEFKPAVLARKPAHAGLWVIVRQSGAKLSVHRLGGSVEYLRGVHPSTFTVVPVDMIPAKLATLLEIERRSKPSADPSDLDATDGES